MPLWRIFLTQATNHAYPTIRARPCVMQSEYSYIQWQEDLECGGFQEKKKKF